MIITQLAIATITMTTFLLVLTEYAPHSLVVSPTGYTALHNQSIEHTHFNTRELKISV